MTARRVAAARTWRRRGPDAQPPSTGAHALGLPVPLIDLLARRGVVDEAAVRSFLRPRIDDLRDPSGLADLPRAVARLRAAIESAETIFVHGDYDVDGMCGAALLFRVLTRLGASVVAFAPHRIRDGYDLGEAGVARARRAAARVLLTVDCGTTAHGAVAAARAAGLDVIVTDHHAVGDRLPDALAVVNPARADCGYGEPLCGTGVAFKLCEALVRACGGSRDDLLWELDLVGLATVADLVPLEGENRVMARYGLRVLANTRNPGLDALMEEAGLDRSTLAERDLSHGLAPRLNAVGRLEDASEGLRLLTGELPADAVGAAAARLGEINRRRQELDRRTLDDALAQLRERDDSDSAYALVAAGRDWHPGVIGIVASRLVELFHRPAFVIAIPDDPGAPARGSGRSIPGFDLVGALAETSSLLIRYGGHAMAAGLDIDAEVVGEFRTAFEAAARRRLSPDQLVPTIAYDAESTVRTLVEDIAPFHRYLGPFGVGNPTPSFLLRRARVEGAARPVGRAHCRLRLEQDGHTIDAIGFGFAEAWEPLEPGAEVDLVARLREDRWRGHRRLQLVIADLCTSTTGGAPPIPIAADAAVTLDAALEGP